MRTWQPTATLDATRIGGSSYSASDSRAVLNMLRNTSYDEPVSVGSIALSTGVEGRAVRQVLQDLDGRVILLGKRSSGIFVCRFADEGDSEQAALEASWRTTRERCRLRLEYAQRTGMGRRQGVLFEDLEQYPDDLDEGD